MRFTADLHIHSKYARAVSPKTNLPELDRWADDKGITLMGTGDFTHPEYFKEITAQLTEAEQGLYKLKREYKLDTLKGFKSKKTRFILSSEVSSIYKRDGVTRRVHTLLFAPSISVAKKINEKLGERGNLKSDGRPILGLDVRDIAEMVLNINERVLIVPAHIWTPWFSMFGSRSGFNSIKECWGGYSRHIFAVETGLSSDPVMNWQVSELDNLALISNSDSHSLERIGREANIFNTELSYDGVVKVLKDNSPKNFIATIEYYPEEGRYYHDGHKSCGVSLDPRTTRSNRGICRVCKKPVVVGVLNRVQTLSDRRLDELKIKEVKIGKVIGKGIDGRVPFLNLVTLDSIIAEALGVKGVKTKAVTSIYKALIQEFDNELDILINIELQAVEKVAGARVGEALRRMRVNEMNITPGYDGEYGEVKIFS